MNLEKRTNEELNRVEHSSRNDNKLTVIFIKTRTPVQPMRTSMNWGFFTTIFTAISLSIPALAGDGVDVSALSLNECLNRTLSILQPQDLKKYRPTDFHEDPELMGDLMRKQFSQRNSPTRYDRDQLPKYLSNMISIPGLPNDFSILKTEELGWSIEKIESKTAETVNITVKHTNGEKRVLETIWPRNSQLREESLIQKKIRFKSAPKPKIRAAQDRIRDLKKKKQFTDAAHSELLLLMLHQDLRAAKALPEYYASLIAKAAKEKLALEKTVKMQSQYYDSITANQIVSLLKKGDRNEFSIRLLFTDQKYTIGNFQDLAGKITSQSSVNGLEKTFEFFPNKSTGIVNLDNGIETDFFVQNIPRTYSSKIEPHGGLNPYAISLKLDQGIELHYLNNANLKNAVNNRKYFITEVLKNSSDRGKKIPLDAPNKPSANLQMPDEIRTFIKQIYSDPKLKLQIAQDDLNQLLQFMKEQEDRIEHVSMYANRNGKKKIIGTISLVTSNKPSELLSVESTLKMPGLVTREGDLPVIEVSRFAMDFSARKQFSSSRFLNITYEIAGSRKASKIVAFCEEEFSKDILSRSAFKATRKDLKFEGKTYYLLEASPADLLKYALEHG